MPTIIKMVGIFVYPCTLFSVFIFAFLSILFTELRTPRALKPASKSAIKRPSRGEPNGAPINDDLRVGVGGFGAGVIVSLRIGVTGITSVPGVSTPGVGAGM